MNTTFPKLLFGYLFALFIGINPSLHAQSTQKSLPYFPDNYSEQPVITYKEGFLSRTTYFLDGEEASPREVATLFKSVNAETFKFLSHHRKKYLGTTVLFSGLAVNIGSIAYLFTNEITSANVVTWYLVTTGGGLLQATGNILVQDAERRIGLSIDDFNAYHYSGGADAYLSMDVSARFFGPKIDIYEGPMLLQNEQILSFLKSNKEAFDLYEQVQKRQKVSTATHIVNSALSIGVMFVAVGFQRQSSRQNQLLLPMTFTGIGLNVFSSFFERRTRNLTREALYRYNYQ